METNERSDNDSYNCELLNQVNPEYIVIGNECFMKQRYVESNQIQTRFVNINNRGLSQNDNKPGLKYFNCNICEQMNWSSHECNHCVRPSSETMSISRPPTISVQQLWEHNRQSVPTLLSTKISSEIEWNFSNNKTNNDLNKRVNNLKLNAYDLNGDKKEHRFSKPESTEFAIHPKYVMFGTYRCEPKAFEFNSDGIKLTEVASNNVEDKYKYHISIPFAEMTELKYCYDNTMPSIFIKPTLQSNCKIRESMLLGCKSKNGLKFDINSTVESEHYIKIAIMTSDVSKTEFLKIMAIQSNPNINITECDETKLEANTFPNSQMRSKTDWCRIFDKEKENTNKSKISNNKLLLKPLNQELIKKRRDVIIELNQLRKSFQNNLLKVKSSVEHLASCSLSEDYEDNDWRSLTRIVGNLSSNYEKCCQDFDKTNEVMLNILSQ